MGRPSKLTPEIQAAIVRDLEGGNYLSTAAEANGVRYRRVQRWVQLGKSRPESIYGEFRRAVKRARRKGESDLLARVREGKPGWQGSAWILERTRRHKYGRVMREDAADASKNADIITNLAEVVRREKEAERGS